MHLQVPPEQQVHRSSDVVNWPSPEQSVSFSQAFLALHFVLHAFQFLLTFSLVSNIQANQFSSVIPKSFENIPNLWSVKKFLLQLQVTKVNPTIKGSGLKDSSGS